MKPTLAPNKQTEQPLFEWRPRLSEAIREGAKLHPKSTGSYFDFDGNGNCIGSCAVGAAIEAVLGRIPDYSESGDDEEDKAAALLGLFNSGGPGSGYNDLWEGITKRNDELGWTREAIADWLEGQGY